MTPTLESTATALVRRLREAGHEAYWVGGCVRNRLMGAEVDEIDVATSAPPEAVGAMFPGAEMVGARFGVAVVPFHGRAFEVATFRRDGRYVDHRHPESVTFGTLEQDARRRDFTVNALYLDPLNERLVDLVGGRRDIASRTLRCVGEPARRFEEDALRLMRAVRFATRFDLTVEPATAAAMRDKAGLIASISPERVRDELVRMMTGPRPGRALERLSESGLLARILPEVEAMKGCEQPPEFHPEGDVFTHTVLTLDNLPPAPSPTLAIAALLHDVGKPPTFEAGPDRIRFPAHASTGAELADPICRRLRFSNRDRERIVALVKRHMTFMDVRRMKTATLRRFVAAPTIEEDCALHRADARASHGDPSSGEFCLERREDFRREAENVLPPPLLDGNDLIAMGYEPGPRFREILDAVADAQMEGEVADPDAARDWVRRRYPRGEGTGDDD